MLSSIYFRLSFDDVKEARQCLRNVSGKNYYHVAGVFSRGQGSQHIIIVKADRTWTFGFDEEDIRLLTDGCKRHSFMWSFDVLTEEDVVYYINMHKS